MATLEHVNLTVGDPIATANLLCELFDWKIRWQGEAIDGGFSVHVGGANSYLALYRGAKDKTPPQPGANTYNTLNGLNHLGIMVEDIDATESRIKAAGYSTYSHGDYEPGKRFYFDIMDKLEIEIISY